MWANTAILCSGDNDDDGDGGRVTHKAFAQISRAAGAAVRCAVIWSHSECAALESRRIGHHLSKAGLH